MKDKAIEIFDSEGVEAAIGWMQAGEAGLSPTEHVQVFDQVLRHAYWQHKDLPAAIQIGQAGLALGEKLAAAHPDQASEIKSQIKAIQYNLASFTWPGWDEPGYQLSEKQVLLGLEAARQNLSLALELKKEALPLSRAYWMLAAQEIAAKEYTSAVEHFSQAETFARQAGVQGEALLAQGFELLTKLLANPGDLALETSLEETKTALATEEHGEIFVKQIEDALRVFSS
jgi:hypothetical protein